MALQIRRGTNAERLGITPVIGELVYTTDSKRLFVGDGSTAGGIAVSSGFESLLEDTTPQLGGNLDLNGHSITGTGSINIDGTITATGSINLGDASEDNINVAGSITTSLNPAIDSTVDIGSQSLRWRNGYFAGINVDGEINAIAVNANLVADNSTVSYDALTGNFTGNLTGNVTGDVTGDVTGNVTGALEGDVKGSLFGNDSSPIVDGINRTVTAQIVDTNDFSANEASINNILTTGYTANGQGQLIIQRDTLADSSSDQVAYGNIVFRVNDANGLSGTKSLIQAGRQYIRFINDANDVVVGTSPNTTSMTWFDNKLVVGGRNTSNPERLQVIGDASVAGYIQTEQIKIDDNYITTTVSNANLELRANGTGTIELDVPTQLTVGAAGAASALPASPDIYFKINVGGTEYVVPGFAVS